MSKSYLEMTPGEMGQRGSFLNILATVGVMGVMSPNLVGVEYDVRSKGVEVYGIAEKIDTVAKFDDVYRRIAETYEDALPWDVSDDRFVRRSEYWGDNIRAIEFVVPQSEYDKHKEQGGFVAFATQQIDMDNAILRQADPKTNLQAKLVRIIVVSDNFVTHPANRWTDSTRTFGSFAVSPDVDRSEFYGDESKKGEGRYYWKVTDKGSALEVSHESGESSFGDKNFIIPHNQMDSLTGAKDVSIDYYSFHERMHRLYQVPDDYRPNLFKLDDEKFGFRQMVVENGNWSIPYLNPFNMVVMNWNAARGIRGHYDHPQSLGVSDMAEYEIYAQQPSAVSVTIPGAQQIEIFSTQKRGNYNAIFEEPENGRRVTGLIQDVEGSSLDLDLRALNKPSYFREEKLMVNAVQTSRSVDVPIVPTVYVLTAIKDGKRMSLNFPVAILNMSKLGGGLDSANYIIDIVGNTVADSEVLVCSYINDSDLSSRVHEIKNAGGEIYASMKIDGVEATCLWYQKHPEVIKKSVSPNLIGVRPLQGQ